MANLTIQQKKEWAKETFLHHNISNKELAAKIGISENTAGKWVKEWDHLKVNYLQSREEQYASTIRQLEDLRKIIEGRDVGYRFPSKEEAMIKRRLTADLKDLDTEGSVRDIIYVSKTFLDWLRPVDLAKAQDLSGLFDAFIKDTIR
jgi:transposase